MANALAVFANGGGLGGPHPFFPFGMLGGVVWLLVLVGAALLIVWAVRALPAYRPATAVAPVPETPLEILARRYASGEVTTEEYEKQRDVLRAEPPKQ